MSHTTSDLRTILGTCGNAEPANKFFFGLRTLGMFGGGSVGGVGLASCILRPLLAVAFRKETKNTKKTNKIVPTRTPVLEATCRLPFRPLGRPSVTDPPGAQATQPPVYAE